MRPGPDRQTAPPGTSDTNAPTTSAHALQPLIQHINAPSPPLFEQDHSQFSLALRTLNVRLTAGSLLILFGDFADLQQTDLKLLRALSARHSVTALHIIDPIERAVPGQGSYAIWQEQQAATTTLDCNNPIARNAANRQLEQGLSDIENLFTQAGVAYERIDSNRNYLQTTQARTGI